MSSTLNGNRITRARASIPSWGCPWYEIDLDGEIALSGAVTLQLEDLTLLGTIVSGGSDKGRSSYRVVGGAAGWGKEIAALSYSNDAGVKLSKVLGDAANAAGETLDASTIPASTVGPSYIRDAGPAGRVLEQLASEAWYIDEAGVTKLGRRPAVAFAGKAALGPIDRARGTVTLASESLASLLPGVTIEGLEAVDILHEVSAEGGARTVLWGKGAALVSRRLAAFRRLFEALDPGRRFAGVFEYRVVSQSGERLDLQAVRVSSGMPDLRRAVVRPGVAGCRADVAMGSRVLVAFIDSDPARPIVVGFEDAEGSGFLSTTLSLDATDTVAVGPSADMVELGSGSEIGVSSPTGRVLRWGDPIFPPTVAQCTSGAPFPLMPAVPGVTPVAKASA